MNKIIKLVNRPLIPLVTTFALLAINIYAKLNGLVAWCWWRTLWPILLPEAVLGWLMLVADLIDRKRK